MTMYVIADLIVDINEFLEGGFSDWPAEIQDRVHKTVQMESLARGRKYKIERAYCGMNDGVAFIHVVVKSPLLQ